MIFKDVEHTVYEIWDDIQPLTGFWTSRLKLFISYSVSSIALNIDAFCIIFGLRFLVLHSSGFLLSFLLFNLNEGKVIRVLTGCLLSEDVRVHPIHPSYHF